MPMTLLGIEQALKGQFIFAKPRQKASETEYEFLQRRSRLHRLHCNEDRELIKSLAIIIFIGIAEQYNIEEEATIEYLQIDYRNYRYYNALFDRYLNEVNLQKEMGRKLSPHLSKFYTKLGLCRNYLNFHFKK